MYSKQIPTYELYPITAFQNFHVALSSWVCSAAALMMAVAVSCGADTAVRVAVKLNGPVTPEIVSELSRKGPINHAMPRMRLVDMTLQRSDLEKLRADPRVRYVEADRVELVTSGAPVEMHSADLVAGRSVWNLDAINVTDSFPHALARPEPSRIVKETGEGIYVALLDTGLRTDWRDFFDPDSICTELARSFLTPASIFPDLVYSSPGGQHAHEGEAPHWDKDPPTNGHGTAVASFILGFRLDHPRIPLNLNLNGVAPNVQIIPVRWINAQGYGSTLDAVRAVDYITDLVTEGRIPGRVVINNSWGFSRGPVQTLHEAIESAIAHGVIVVAGAGNAGPLDIQEFGVGITMLYPWATAPQVITTGSAGWKRHFTDPIWQALDVPENSIGEFFVASYSSRALPGQQLDLVAPGHYPFGTLSPQGFDVHAGTSFACPHVVGAVALLLEKNPSLTQGQVESILKASALPIPAGNGYADPYLPSAPWSVLPSDQGSGLLQVDRALRLLP
jgi:subtilisin family serine protease